MGAPGFFLETQTDVTPVLRIGYRVSVGARCLARRTATPGLIGIEILRGDGEPVESYTATVDFRVYGPFDAGEEVEVVLAAIDMVGTGSYPRTYQLRVVAIGELANIAVRDANIATSPYSEPGFAPP